MPSEIPACPQVPCSCVFAETHLECVCGPTERALRFWSQEPGRVLMSEPQRQWCLREIDGVEGHNRLDYEGCSDAALAGAVLHAWRDYARDKGLY
jgi:hypothetical protein